MRAMRHPSPLVALERFSNRLIFDDTLHVAYRGFAPNFIAAALIDVFGRGQSLTRAFVMALSWARIRGHELSLDEFALSEDKYPSLNAKGWDCKILCLWLATWHALRVWQGARRAAWGTFDLAMSH